MNRTIYNVELYVYNAKLDRVVDGDTVDAMIDLGFDTWVFKRIRLLGTAGSLFVLRSEGLDKYGRSLGIIYVKNTNINELLVKEGLAEVYE